MTFLGSFHICCFLNYCNQTVKSSLSAIYYQKIYALSKAFQENQQFGAWDFQNQRQILTNCGNYFFRCFFVIVTLNVGTVEEKTLICN